MRFARSITSESNSLLACRYLAAQRLSRRPAVGLGTRETRKHRTYADAQLHTLEKKKQNGRTKAVAVFFRLSAKAICVDPIRGAIVTAFAAKEA